jgi:hypothetical protein
MTARQDGGGSVLQSQDQNQSKQVLSKFSGALKKIPG